MKDADGGRAPAFRDGPRTLAIDVGGTGLKASVLDGAGQMLVKRVRVATPYPCQPEILLRAIAELTARLPSFDRISIGFPGVIRDRRVITAAHFDAEAWRDYPLRRPCRAVSAGRLVCSTMRRCRASESSPDGAVECLRRADAAGCILNEDRSFVRRAPD